MSVSASCSSSAKRANPVAPRCGLLRCRGLCRRFGMGRSPFLPCRSSAPAPVKDGIAVQPAAIGVGHSGIVMAVGGDWQDWHTGAEGLAVATTPWGDYGRHEIDHRRFGPLSTHSSSLVRANSGCPSPEVTVWEDVKKVALAPIAGMGCSLGWRSRADGRGVPLETRTAATRVRWGTSSACGRPVLAE